MKLKLMILDDPEVIGTGVVLCDEHGVVLPNQIRVDIYSPGIGEHATVSAEFAVDGSNVVWASGPATIERAFVDEVDMTEKVVPGLEFQRLAADLRAAKARVIECDEAVTTARDVQGKAYEAERVAQRAFQEFVKKAADLSD